jgi:hypothetical protein
MKFIKNLSIIIEGIGSHQNVKYNFNISDKTPLQVIEIFKKSVDYINEILKEIYKEKHTDFYIKINNPIINYFNDNNKLSLIFDVSDFDKYFLNEITLKDLKYILIEKFKKIYENNKEKINSNDFINLINYQILRKISFSIYNENSNHELFSLVINKDNVSNGLLNFLHDFNLHTILDNKDIYKFQAKDKEGKLLYMPLKSDKDSKNNSKDAKTYSPEEILRELYALLGNHYNFDFKINDFIINNVDFSILKINEIFKDNNNFEKKIKEKIKEIILYNDFEGFSEKEIKYIILKIKKNVKITDKEINYIIKPLYLALNKMENRFYTKDYKRDFIDLLKSSDIFNENTTFKDFKEHFKDYPTFLKIFINFKDDQKIFELNQQDSEKLTNLISRSIYATSSILKTKTNDIEYKLPKIDYSLNRIGNFIKNIRPDNFIKMLKKEIT